MIDSVVQARSVEGILSSTVRVTLGGQAYVLPVLPRGPARRWRERVGTQLGNLLGAIEATDDLPVILAALLSHSDELLAALIEFDAGHLLPSADELDEHATDNEILLAVMEVWQAVNPFLAITRVGILGAIAGNRSAPSSSPSASGATPRRRSRKN